MSNRYILNPFRRSYRILIGLSALLTFLAYYHFDMLSPAWKNEHHQESLIKEPNYQDQQEQHQPQPQQQQQKQQNNDQVDNNVAIADKSDEPYTPSVTPEESELKEQSRLEKWPPNNPQDLFDPQTGFYNLTLPIRVLLDSELKSTDWIQEYVKYLEDHFREQEFQGSSLRQLVQMDEQMRLGTNQPNYLLYPQAIDVKPIVEAVKRGEPVNQVPINNPELMAVQIPRHVCSPNQNPTKQYDLVVLVKSCVFCFKEREQARQTFMKPELWTDFSIGFVFVVGQPVDPLSLNLTFSVLLTDQTSSPLDENLLNSIRTLNQEYENFGDLLIGSFQDTYFNLTYKQILGFRWVSAFCRRSVNLTLFLDHDRAIIPQNMISFIDQIPDEMKPQLVGGMRYVALDVIREPTKQKMHPTFRKWIVSTDEIPWTYYPPFIPGPSYLVGSSVIEDVAIANAFTQYFRLEDVYLGFVLRKLDRVLVAFKEFTGNGFKLDNVQDSVCLSQAQANNIYSWETGMFRQ